MNPILSSVLIYLKTALIESAIQLTVMLVPLLSLALLLNLLSSQTEKLLLRLFGTRAYLSTIGWLGTPVHETGHALFALLFGHKITRMNLYKPDPKTGTMGFVAHSYHPRNLYHQIGNFFIGIGPIIMGTLVLLLLSKILFGVSVLEISQLQISYETFTSLSGIKAEAVHLAGSLVNYFSLLVTNPATSWWKLILGFYILLAIGSTLKLSWPDLKGAGTGLFFVVVLVLILNLSTQWMGPVVTGWLIRFSPYLSGFYFLMLLSITLCLGFLLFLFIILLIKQLIGIKK